MPESDQGPKDPRPAEPLWFVRAVLVLFLIGFTVFLAREIRAVVEALG